MGTAFLVFVGGGFGAVGRWLAGLAAFRLWGAGFPHGTLWVNLLGCFVMGVFARVLTQTPGSGHDLRVFLMTGVLGGFTTFSAFSLDAATLWMRGEGGAAAIYVTLSVAGSLAALAAGLWLGGLFAR